MKHAFLSLTSLLLLVSAATTGCSSTGARDISMS